jgi:excisionase family DNA binding protein
VGAGELAALRAVLLATGGQAKIRELYVVLSTEEAAEFLGLAPQTVHNRVHRHELPYTEIGKRKYGYQLIDLIAWLDARNRPATA